jgi:nucleoside 2-deoxyribosyltransferase
MHPFASAYLAGPDVFLPDAKAVGDAKKSLLLTHGIVGHFPLDNEVKEMSDGHALAHEIFLQNVALIDHCDIVLANIVAFRGPSLDPGTAWEIGYAYAKAIPVICYGSLGTYLDRCRHAGLEGKKPKHDLDGLVIEDLGEPDNLMISRCATLIVEGFEEAAGAAWKLLASSS